MQNARKEYDVDRLKAEKEIEIQNNVAILDQIKSQINSIELTH